MVSTRSCSRSCVSARHRAENTQFKQLHIQLGYCTRMPDCNTACCAGAAGGNLQRDQRLPLRQGVYHFYIQNTNSSGVNLFCSFDKGIDRGSGDLAEYWPDHFLQHLAGKFLLSRNSTLQA